MAKPWEKYQTDSKPWESYQEEKEPSTIEKIGEGLEAFSGFMSQVGEGATFGFSDELAGLVGGPEAAEAQRRIREGFAEEYPKTALAGELVGAVAGPAGIVRAVPGAAKLAKGVAEYGSRGTLRAAGAAAGTGAVSGGLYGAGTSEDRAEGAITGAGYGFLGGPIGVGVTKVASPVARRVIPTSLKERAARVFSGGAADSRGVVPSAPLAPELAEEMQKGQILPLTKGQAGQVQKAQALENMARAGAIDDAAQDAMRQADRLQQEAIKKAAGSADEEALLSAANMIKQDYRAMRGAVGEAYDNAQAIRNVFVNKQPIDESFMPRVQDIMYKQGFDVTNMSPETQKLLQKTNLGGDVSAVNLEKMEFWRRKLTNRANQLKGDPEGVMLNRVVKEYDDFMSKLPSEALKSGDESALKAIENARSLRKRQGVLFERDKMIRNIVQNDDLTNEELANMALTGTAGGKAINPASGRLLKRMKRASSNPELLTENIRKGVIGRAMEKAKTNVLQEQTEIQVIAPNKLLKELDLVAKNKTFYNEAFDEAGRARVDALRSDLRKIVSTQEGAKNYSNTAYAFISFLRDMPFMLSGVSGLGKAVAKPIGDRSARRALNKNLSNVMPELQSELFGMPEFYGAAAGGVGAKQFMEEDTE